MPVVEITFFEGRTIEQKRQIAKEITDTISRVAGSRAEGIHVLFREIKKDQWASGGMLSADRQANK